MPASSAFTTCIPHHTWQMCLLLRWRCLLTVTFHLLIVTFRLLVVALHAAHLCRTARASGSMDDSLMSTMRSRVGSALAPAPATHSTGMPFCLQAASSATCDEVAVDTQLLSHHSQGTDMVLLCTLS